MTVLPWDELKHFINTSDLALDVGFSDGFAVG